MLKHEVRRMILAKYGRPKELLEAVDKMDEPAIRQLFHVLRAYESEVQSVRKTFRPFPGGPKMRVR